MSNSELSTVKLNDLVIRLANETKYPKELCRTLIQEYGSSILEMARAGYSVRYGTVIIVKGAKGVSNRIIPRRHQLSLLAKKLELDVDRVVYFFEKYFAVLEELPLYGYPVNLYGIATFGVSSSGSLRCKGSSRFRSSGLSVRVSVDPRYAWRYSKLIEAV